MTLMLPVFLGGAAFAVPFLDDSEGIWIHFRLGDCHETTAI
jgi:hypothetical protein